MNRHTTNPYMSYGEKSAGGISHDNANGLHDNDTEASHQNRKDLWHSKLPLMLRWLGGVTLITSAFIFLISGWIDAEPLYRYYSFFGFTAVMAGAGLYCGSRLKEDKGARTFLGLAACFLPAHFCQLGAMSFAEFVGAASEFPSHFSLLQFNPIGAPLLAGTLVVATVSLAVVAFMGFSAMARSEAKRLTFVYMLANAFLLIPTRDSAIIAGLGFALLAFLVAMDLKFFSRQASLKNWDGIAMRSLLFSPFAIMLGRSLMLHDSSSLILSLVYASVSGVLFIALPRCVENERAKGFFQDVSLIPLFVSWCYIVDACPFIGYVDFEVFTLAIALPFSLIVVLASFYSHGRGRKYRRLAAIIALGCCIAQLLSVGGVQISILTLVVAVAVMVSAFAMQEKGLLLMGIAGISVSIIYHIHYALELYQQNLWLSLALTGTVAILASSYIERHWREVIGRGRMIREKLHTWD